MQLRDLWVDSADPDRLSQSKFWSNVAYTVGSAVIITAAVKGTLTGDMLLIYLGVVGLHTVSSKAIGLKFSSPKLSNMIEPTPDDTSPNTPPAQP